MKDKNNKPALAAARAVLETHGKLDSKTEAKEIIAYLAKNRPTHTLVQRVVRAIRQALRRMGMEMNISESEIFDMIRNMREIIPENSCSKTEA